MLLSLLIAIAAFIGLVWHTREQHVAMGLPVAYLFSLLLQHLPGGVAHLLGGWYFLVSADTAMGLWLTAIGAVSFVGGVVVVRHACRNTNAARIAPSYRDLRSSLNRDLLSFARFCLFGGWLVLVLGVAAPKISSVGAILSQASSVWILGVTIGVLVSVKNRRWTELGYWILALSAYPVLVLLFSGFLSFGSTSVFVVFASLLVTLKSNFRAYTALLLFSTICVCTFLSYFLNRDYIRDAVWGGAELGERLDRSVTIISDMRWFDWGDPRHLNALDQRLNQNSFAGAAARRLESGEVDFLRGKSVSDGVQAMVPRLLWPDKPVFAGSSEMIRGMSGFHVNENTSFGVGQVMEFYINFGLISLVLGFVLFGMAYGWLDYKVASAIKNGDFGNSLFWFIPGIGMLAPLASIAEILGNVAAAFIAGYGWRLIWLKLSRRFGAGVNFK